MFSKEGRRERKKRKVVLFQGSVPSQTPWTSIIETGNILLQVGLIPPPPELPVLAQSLLGANTMLKCLTTISMQQESQNTERAGKRVKWKDMAT